MAGKIALIDGNALVHRAFHALPPLTSPKGELVNATYGVATMLLKVLHEMRPEFAAAAFDTPVPTFRHREFDGYKGTRGPAPEGLHEQFVRVYEFLNALGIPVFRADGFEADDLLGTLARLSREKGLEVIIVTGDTDALQLVDPHVAVLTSRRGFTDTVLYDLQAVRERYGVEPAQLVDLKALKGDTSDNIPGVPGIGEKTASKLVAEFGDLEGIYSNLDHLSAKVRQQLESYHDQAFFSRRLAQIVKDVPAQLDLDLCRTGKHDRARLIEMFRELGFRSLIDRIPAGRVPEPVAVDGPGRAATAGEQLALFGATLPAKVLSGETAGLLPQDEVRAGYSDKTAADADVECADEKGYQVVGTGEQLAELVSTLRQAPMFALDMETTGRDVLQADLVGLSFAVRPGAAYYVPVGHFRRPPEGLGLLLQEDSEDDGADEPEQLSLDEVVAALKPVLEDESIPKCAHNGKFDMLSLARYGVEVRGLVFDTMVAAYLLESGQRALGLKDLVWTRLKQEMQNYADLAGKGKAAVTLDRLPIRKVADYSCADADMTLRLRDDLKPELESSGLYPLFERVEMPLVPVLVDMERIGVALDADHLKGVSTELYSRLRELEIAVYEAAGHSFNLGSTQQLAAVLFGELKLPATRKTKTGYSTDADVLEELKGTHTIIELILEYRQMVKLKSTYVDALPLLVNPRTGRVHTSFNQTSTTTGRLSSSDPNLQNIPIRTEMGRRVRRAFVVPDLSKVLLSVDYSQIELRVLAHMTGDPTLVGAFLRGEDIHAATAAEVYGIPITEVTGRERRIAKTVNFGVLYGMSDYGLARDSGLTRKEAAMFIERYFQRYGSVKAFFDTIKAEAEEKGYVSTLLGRRRYIPELRTPNRGVRQAAERMAINMPIQGTAADIIKIAMINLHRLLKDGGFRSKMILQVHDELLFECPREEVEVLAPEIKRLMESAMSLQVPLVVEAKVGSNWDEMVRLPL